MVSPLVDDAPKDTKNTPKIIETDPWLELGLQRLEPHAGSTPLRFEREQSGELVGLVGIEIQSERNALIDNYCAYHTTPAATIVLSHDNNAAVSAGIAVSGTVVIGGAITFGRDVTFGDVSKFGGCVVQSRFAYHPGFRVVARIERQKDLPSTLERRLEELRQLPAGWDSYGALQINRAAIEAAKAVVTQALSDEIGLPAPFIAPTSPGGIGLEWKPESGKELLLEISPTGDVSYLLVEPRPDGGEDEAEDYISDPGELKKLLLSLSE